MRSPVRTGGGSAQQTLNLRLSLGFAQLETTLVNWLKRCLDREQPMPGSEQSFGISVLRFLILGLQPQLVDLHLT